MSGRSRMLLILAIIALLLTLALFVFTEPARAAGRYGPPLGGPFCGNGAEEVG